MDDVVAAVEGVKGVEGVEGVKGVKGVEGTEGQEEAVCNVCLELSSAQGMAPSVQFVQEVYDYVDARAPIRVVLRPSTKKGTFAYTWKERLAMLAVLQTMAVAGASGVVIDVLLNGNGEVDVVNTSKLVQEAERYGLGVTYHRDVAQDAVKTFAFFSCGKKVLAGER